MNKEEILRRSQMEKQDEGKDFVFASGKKSGVIGMMAIFMFLSIYYLYTENHAQIFPLLATIFGYLTFESIAIFRLTKENFKLLKVCIGLLLCLFFLIRSIL